MKLVLKLICIKCLLLSCSGKQTIKYLTDLEQANIKGHVTKLVTETYKVDSLEQRGELESVTIEIFDKLGFTSTDTIKDFVENKETVNFLVYNKNGSLSSISTFNHGKKYSKILLKYYEDKCTLIENFDSNDKLESYYGDLQQNNFGLLLNLKSYDPNNKLTMSYENAYDGIYQVSGTAKDSAGILSSEVRIQLSGKKHPEDMLEITYLKDTVIKKYLSYKYKIWDEKGNWTEQTIFNEKGKAIKIVSRTFRHEQ